MTCLIGHHHRNSNTLTLRIIPYRTRWQRLLMYRRHLTINLSVPLRSQFPFMVPSLKLARGLHRLHAAGLSVGLLVAMARRLAIRMLDCHRDLSMAHRPPSLPILVHTPLNTLVRVTWLPISAQGHQGTHMDLIFLQLQQTTRCLHRLVRLTLHLCRLHIQRAKATQ